MGIETAVVAGVTLAKVATAAKIAAAAGAATTSFVKAKQQNKAQQKAERAADEALADARKRIDVNYLEGLSIPKEAYELEREALLSSGAQALQAGVEGSTRGAAATAGRVQMAQQQGQRRVASAMGQELFGLQKLAAGEDARIAGMQAGLSLKELEGQQEAAMFAQIRGEQQTQRGIQGLGEAVKLAGDAIPEYMPDAATRSTNKLNRQFNRAQRKGDIDGTMTIGEFGNLNPVTSSIAPGYDPMAYSVPGTDNFSSVSYEQNPRDFFSEMTPFEQRQYFKNR
tara:strand:+ start:2071 stop:2919 length:849 start_codon:yes stop_codon:yes gene_type:complete